MEKLFFNIGAMVWVAAAGWFVFGPWGAGGFLLIFWLAKTWYARPKKPPHDWLRQKEAHPARTRQFPVRKQQPANPYLEPFLAEIELLEDKGLEKSYDIDFKIDGSFVGITSSGFNRAFKVLKDRLMPTIKEAGTIVKRASAVAWNSPKRQQMEKDLRACIASIEPIKENMENLELIISDISPSGNKQGKITNLYDKVEEVLEDASFILENWQEDEQDAGA